ncbi:hypothetical protein BaRGS_00016727 [Batillaria attramentaria]|uniref:Uncharacterized protein n=1 Tax=Batillaria attramentaria TaxID=370345 RepID=A0ABD0KYN7_9CAEN
MHVTSLLVLGRRCRPLPPNQHRWTPLSSGATDHRDNHTLTYFTQDRRPGMNSVHLQIFDRFDQVLFLSLTDNLVKPAWRGSFACALAQFRSSCDRDRQVMKDPLQPGSAVRRENTPPRQHTVPGLADYWRVQSVVAEYSIRHGDPIDWARSLNSSHFSVKLALPCMGSRPCRGVIHPKRAV